MKSISNSSFSSIIDNSMLKSLKRYDLGFSVPKSGRSAADHIRHGQRNVSE